MTRNEIIGKISSKTAESVQKGLTNLSNEVEDCFSKVSKSVTCDNGYEFPYILDSRQHITIITLNSSNTNIYMINNY